MNEFDAISRNNAIPKRDVSLYQPPCVGEMFGIAVERTVVVPDAEIIQFLDFRQEYFRVTTKVLVEPFGF